LGAAERGERKRSSKQLLKIAQALGMDPDELFIIDDEELSGTKLQRMIQDLLQEADKEELQLAYKLLKALPR
jgi:transcriptional regulator with XRE-family HTH domain